MDQVVITPPRDGLQLRIALPASKSISNRALIIQQLAGGLGKIHNLSSASDTLILKSALVSSKLEIDVKDAGTAMRFLTAFFATQEGVNHILTGTSRMRERPIGILVEALQTLGADIEYLGNEGYPPLKIVGKKLNGGRHTIRANESSQYISALLMIAPILRGGLTLVLSGQQVSAPYVKMTLGVMAAYGIKYTITANEIEVLEQDYKSSDYTVESDWSGASYWYEALALAKEGSVEIVGLTRNSLQGDEKIAELMESLGVISSYDNDGVTLSKNRVMLPEIIEQDFSAIPDLLPTVSAICAGLKVKLKATRVAHLRIKETNRLEALKQELEKLGAVISISQDTFAIEGFESLTHNDSIEMKTYQDHRMAMSLAALSQTFGMLTIQQPTVVNKSYPTFWEHMELAGFELSFNS